MDSRLVYNQNNMLKQQSGRPLSKSRAYNYSQPLLVSTCNSLSSNSSQSHPLHNQPQQSPNRNNQLSKSGDKAEWLGKQPGKVEGKNNQQAKEQLGWCPLHKKELQIMCLTDRVRICPHCALFSTHRQHDLRTVEQISDLLRQRMEEWRECNQRKVQLDRKLNSSTFRQAMIAKITVHKNKLVNEIKQKFKELQENIKLAEKRAFDDVAKRFKVVAQKIALLDRQEQQSHLLYQKWNNSCLQLFQTTSFDAKAIMLAGGGLYMCKQGLPLMKQMEQKADKKIEAIQSIVNSIKVAENQAVPNSIFNYLNITMQQPEEISTELAIVRVESYTSKDERQEPIKINSVKVIKDPSSPLSHSHKRGGSSHRSQHRNSHKPTNASNNRKPSQLTTALELQTIIAQFCGKQQMDTLDLSNCELLDSELYELLAFIKTKKKIRALKLGRNKITTQGFAKILELIPLVTNMNLCFNQLSEDAVNELLRSRHKVPQLRIVNLSNNSLNERRCQTAIEQLKKQGLIVTI